MNPVLRPYKKRFSINERLKSFTHAISGLIAIIQSQHNAWIHLLFTAVTIAAGLKLEITESNWLAIILAIMAVWGAEAFNTAFEFLADVASPEFHPLVKKAKDVAAAAVLIAATGAFIIGIIVFHPYIVLLF